MRVCNSFINLHEGDRKLFDFLFQKQYSEKILHTIIRLSYYLSQALKDLDQCDMECKIPVEIIYL